MPARFGISPLPKNPIVFAGLYGCEKNAGSGLWEGIWELETFSLRPRNALGGLEQQPGALVQEVGDAAFSPCVVSCRRGKTNARL